MSDILLAIDPSITRIGLALFVDGDLYTTGVVLPTLGTKADIMERVAEMSECCYAWGISHGHTVTDIACEWPQIYPKGRAKGDPNHIVPLAAVCGSVAGFFRRDAEVTLTSYKPRAWAGTMPKDETVKGCKSSPRARRTIKCLSSEEMKVWAEVEYHDEIDAIGIGLHYLKRFRPRIMPGATKG